DASVREDPEHVLEVLQLLVVRGAEDERVTTRPDALEVDECASRGEGDRRRPAVDLRRQRSWIDSRAAVADRERELAASPHGAVEQPHLGRGLVVDPEPE